MDHVWRRRSPRKRQPIPDPRSPIPAQASGQAMVEMALVMAIVLMVILGGIDGLQILMTQYTVNQAVRASAHQAALIGGPDGSNGSLRTTGPHATGTVAETARTILNSGMTTSADDASIIVTCARNPCRRYDPITVRITYQAGIWAPIGPFKLVQADLKATRLAEKDRQ
jgi:TadE-like protein